MFEVYYTVGMAVERKAEFAEWDAAEYTIRAWMHGVRNENVRGAIWLGFDQLLWIQADEDGVQHEQVAQDARSL